MAAELAALPVPWALLTLGGLLLILITNFKKSGWPNRVGWVAWAIAMGLVLGIIPWPFPPSA